MKCTRFPQGRRTRIVLKKGATKKGWSHNKQVKVCFGFYVQKQQRCRSPRPPRRSRRCRRASTNCCRPRTQTRRSSKRRRPTSRPTPSSHSMECRARVATCTHHRPPSSTRAPRHCSTSAPTSALRPTCRREILPFTIFASPRGAGVRKVSGNASSRNVAGEIGFQTLKKENAGNLGVFVGARPVNLFGGRGKDLMNLWLSAAKQQLIRTVIAEYDVAGCVRCWGGGAVRKLSI